MNFMKTLLVGVLTSVLFATMAAAQKGVDTQTQKIRQDTSKTTQTDRESGRGWSFGKDKTKVRERLANPYKLAARRDALVDAVLDVLKEKKLVTDDTSTRLEDGIVVTMPVIFVKGAVVALSELGRYAILPESEATWRGGRYSLRIEVVSVDGTQHNVSVTAKVEGKSENGMRTEWITLPSSGQAEEDFLVKLVEAVTGNSPDDPIDN